MDFGTSTSSAALVAGGETIMIKEPSSKSWLWPSVVYLDDDGTLLVGTHAEERSRVHPACYRAEFKRDLGQDTPIVLARRRFPPERLVTAMLAAFGAEAMRVHDAPVERAVLTVPAAYESADPRRQLMIEAAEAAGFKMVELIAEPVAAALAAPTGEPFADGDLVLVYDFGGGTFDAALIRIGHFRFEPDVLGHRSLEDCGGRDIDAAVNAWLREHGSQELRTLLQPSCPDKAQALASLRSRLEFASMATQLKHQLSEASAAVKIFSPLSLEVTLDAGVLSKLTEPFVTRTVACCTDLLTAAQIRPANLTAVLLVGGGSWMPTVADAVAAELKRPVRTARDPELAVLQGAARFAAQAPERVAVPTPQDEEDRPLRWTVPGGRATFLRWLVGPGDRYRAGQALAEVRLSGGAILRLSDSDSGIIRGQHVQGGGSIGTGDWLVTTGAPHPWRASLGSAPTATLALAGGAIWAGSAGGEIAAFSAGAGTSRQSFAAGTKGAARVVASESAVYASKESGVLYALDPVSGQVRWRQQVTTGKLQAAPVAEAGLVCVWTASGTLFAVSGDDGSVFWKQDIGAPGDGFMTLHDGTIYVVPEGGSLLRALDAADGATRWKFQVSVPIPTPTVVTPTYVLMSEMFGNQAAARRRRALAAAERPAPLPFVRISGPVLVEHGTVYLGSSMSLRALNALTGKQRWSAEVPCSTGPVAVAGLVCAGGPDGMLSALDAGSGTIGWQQRAGRSAITALTTAEDMLYAVTAENDDSQVHAVKAVNGSAAWRWSAPGTLTRPLVSDGMLFAGSSDGSVYAVDVATGKGPEMPRSYT